VRQGTVRPTETLAEATPVQQVLARVIVETDHPGFTELTDALAGWVTGQHMAAGLLTVFCRHTSASLTIQENADPDVLADLMTALDGFAPRHAGYIHAIEGPDDMPAHIRAMLTGASVAVPVLDGKLALGIWQGVYLVEHRDKPHRREVLLHLVGA
jgi:secondary thiamine-phosphate synthase enzyme